MNDIATTITNVVKAQFKRVVNNLNLNRIVEVYEERTFELLNTKNKLNANVIYVVIHFDNSTLMMGGTIIPLVIECMSSSEALQDDLNILFTYATKFNFYPPEVDNLYMQQTYTGPNIESAFENVNGEYRALITMNATFSVGSDILGIKNIEFDNETFLYTSMANGVEYSSNSANIGDSNGLVRSKNKYGVNAFSFNFVALDTNYCRLFFKLMYGLEDMNKVHTLKFTLSDNTIYEEQVIVLKVDYKQNIGGIPSFIVDFGKA